MMFIKKNTVLFTSLTILLAPSLNLFKRPGNVKSLANKHDIIDTIVLKFHDHPGIKTIKDKFTIITEFSFHQVTLVDIRKAIKDLSLDKSSSEDIQAVILRRCDLCFQVLTNYINQSIVSGKFRDSLKLASACPVYKAKDVLDKTNYRSV